jgi:hypothetical protein
LITSIHDDTIGMFVFLDGLTADFDQFKDARKAQKERNFSYKYFKHSFCHSSRHSRGLSSELLPIQKWLICPISVLREKFDPRNITHMPAVKISARLKLNENISFLDGHEFRHGLEKYVGTSTG